jgi:hypothetical protein
MPGVRLIGKQAMLSMIRNLTFSAFAKSAHSSVLDTDELT